MKTLKSKEKLQRKYKKKEKVFLRKKSLHDQSVKSVRVQKVFKPYRKIPEACKKEGWRREVALNSE